MMDHETQDRAREQILLWAREAHEACARRRFIAAFRYFRRALEHARDHGLHFLQAQLCRDAAYVYLHHGATQEARRLLDEGLSLDVEDVALRFGLLSNLATVELLEKNYHEGLNAVERALAVFLHAYPALEGAPFALVSSYTALYKLRRTLRQVVSLLDSGINPERIRIFYRPAPPPWTPAP
ncbi:hypothetical protein SAMN02745206_02880 [Desulfacinum infernum DSM 9756]|jgi:tetratricopeptide (TPR) repeat protein|uniref:Tetratricopeptide repeat-containing protein n=1 Tax=Desulfacinum infernum DSM 9756 TaxID=1121391 RepID=A0A1M5FFE1_9BACT|nr:hypothetical protein [Desulfacinum infernum]SHF90297.1 hypothetical protein SAMN02745206_02880 [Desulfacinum infernum DSM 9756]